jgi:hypothetical protein
MLGAAVYHTIEDFDKCLIDCERALELNPNFIKVPPKIAIWLMNFSLGLLQESLSFEGAAER